MGKISINSSPLDKHETAEWILPGVTILGETHRHGLPMPKNPIATREESLKRDTLHKQQVGLRYTDTSRFAELKPRDTALLADAATSKWNKEVQFTEVNSGGKS